MATKMEKMILEEKTRATQYAQRAEQLNRGIEQAQRELQQILLEHERSMARIIALEALTPDIFSSEEELRDGQ